MFPVAHTLQVRRHVEVGKDYGRPVYDWGEAEDWPVYGWASPASNEPKLAGHDRLVVDVEVFAPTTGGLDHRDKVDLPDGEYEVEGLPEDFNHGPFGFTPGYVVNLRKVAG